MIRRKTAERNLTQLVERARAINQIPDMCYRVTLLIVFGSFVSSTKDPLGDLDVGFWLDLKYLDWEAPERERARQRAPAGRDYLSHISWDRHEVDRALKNRTRHLSLHDIFIDYEAIVAGPHRIVFEEPGGAHREGIERRKQLKIDLCSSG